MSGDVKFTSWSFYLNYFSSKNCTEAPISALNTIPGRPLLVAAGQLSYKLIFKRCNVPFEAFSVLPNSCVCNKCKMLSQKRRRKEEKEEMFSSRVQLCSRKQSQVVCWPLQLRRSHLRTGQAPNE